MKPKLETAVVLTDVHVPYEDTRAFNLVLDVLEELDYQRLYVLGDFSDFATISSHPKSPAHKLPFEEEVRHSREAMELLTTVAARKHRFFYAGNHDFRFERRLAESEFGRFMSYDELIGWTKRGWEYRSYRSEPYYFGKLALFHDAGKSGKHAAASTLDYFGHSCGFGHSHRAQIIYDGTAAGDRRVAINLGWLGDWSQIDYNHKFLTRKQSQLGFGVLRRCTTTDYVWVQFVPILKGDDTKYRCIVDEKVFVR